MKLAKFAVEKPVVTYFIVIILAAGGILSFFTLGQLEDPDFTVKTAVVVTSYPGASAYEVELEVTDRIELAIQEMPQLWRVRSFSKPGLSSIYVDIEPKYNPEIMPQIWDELRRKIRNVEGQLPPGAGRPVVRDDFGDVYGLLFAVTSDGFTYAELEEYVKTLRKELSLVEGVARAELWGVQDKTIYLDVAQTQLAALGISEDTIRQTLSQQNTVVDAGYVEVGRERVRVTPTGAFSSPEDIGDLALRPTLLDSLQNQNFERSFTRAEELIRIRDIGTVRFGYREPPAQIMRFNGEMAIAISLSNRQGANIVNVGRAVDRRLSEIMPLLPVGIEVHKVAWQSDEVSRAVNSFLVSFLQAVLIVLVVLTLVMGWRMAVIIGSALVLTILGTFLVMAIANIDLHRMSLGALIIALGMMVDNAIVVADGYMVRTKRGMNPKEAAVESASQPSWPLLGATIIAVMAFFPIYSSTESVGEYCASLFTVVAISLLVSWLISMMVTPLQCMAMMKESKKKKKKKEGGKNDDDDGGKLFVLFGKFLEGTIRRRWVTLAVLAAVFVAGFLGFGQVEQLFFPDSSRPQFMIDFWATEGTRIQQTSEDLEPVERMLLQDPRVKSVSTFVGAGPPRFYLPVESDPANPSYGEIIVTVHDFKEIDGLITELEEYFSTKNPDEQVPIIKYLVGPGVKWKFEARFSGPAEADPAVLWALAKQGKDIVEASPYAGYVRVDWRQRTKTVIPEYSQERGRWTGTSRDDIAQATKRFFDGLPIGLYRERDDLIPIVMRHTEAERRNVANLPVLQVQPSFSTTPIPLSQVTRDIKTGFEWGTIWRFNRRRAVTVQATPAGGQTFPTLYNNVIDRFNAIEMPPGYSLEWKGELESSQRSQASLIPGLVPAIIIILFIIILLFNEVKPTIIIIVLLPFVVVGIAFGLLGFKVPFGFMSLLGMLSLMGMMIKSAIVLLDQIRLEIGEGKDRYRAVIDSAVARLRPVALAAGTTVLGVAPLLPDVFWVGMAVTIMAGLTVGTIITMILVPVLYATFYKITSPVNKSTGE
jgi:multidrug efflux pump subunit AcrB